MKILNINCRYTDEINIALPFETDAQVVAAWDYIVANRRADSFRYDPEVDGEDGDRAYLHAFFKYHRAGEPLRVPTDDQIRRFVPKIWQAEMNFDIRELLDLTPR